jgi:hypothetical protein
MLIPPAAVEAGSYSPSERSSNCTSRKRTVLVAAGASSGFPLYGQWVRSTRCRAKLRSLHELVMRMQWQILTLAQHLCNMKLT